ASNGILVHRPVFNKWLASIILYSSRHSIKDEPAKNRTAYILETPYGTYPVLVINGELSDEELRNLVENLVPAKEYRGK
ncbi:hypothetical protein ACFL60_06970, partial [Candidatus Omnitrophota bacterium]